MLRTQTHFNLKSFPYFGYAKIKERKWEKSWMFIVFIRKCALWKSSWFMTIFSYLLAASLSSGGDLWNGGDAESEHRIGGREWKGRKNDDGGWGRWQSLIVGCRDGGRRERRVELRRERVGPHAVGELAELYSLPDGHALRYQRPDEVRADVERHPLHLQPSVCSSWVFRSGIDICCIICNF